MNMYVSVHMHACTIHPNITKASPQLKKRLFGGFPGGSAVKNPFAMQEPQEDTGLIPRLGKIPGGGHGNTLQYSCWENPMDRGAWRAAIHGVAESGTTEVTEHTHG